MRILYGVAGEGMGHATRSAVCIAHLVARGHEVHVVASGRAHDYLAARFVRVLRIEGLRLRYRDGSLLWSESVAEILASFPSMLGRNAAVYDELTRARIDGVVTDFEPFASLFAAARNLPCASVDNLQALARFVHHPDVVGDQHAAIELAGTLSRAMAGKCGRYVVTSFFYPPVRPDCAADTATVPPIVRPSLASLPRRDDGPVLVYHTDKSGVADAIGAVGRALPAQRFVAYGVDQRAPLPPNVAARPFSEDGFARDLAAAHAVVTTGGMSLLGECVALGKPALAVPVRGHPEQVFNTRWLTALGFGCCDEFLMPESVHDFLRSADSYRRALDAAPRHDGNAALAAELDRVCAWFAGRPGV